MLSEAFDSFKDNIKQKIANPFLGTLLLVWIVRNWKVVYAFFFFDKEYKLQDRIDYFNSYWKENSFIWNLVGVLFLTVLVLVITYLFLGFSRFISNYYENVVIPQIQKWAKGGIVTSEVYQTALDRIVTIESRFEAERKAKNEAINERDEFEKRLYSSKIVERGLTGKDGDEITLTDDSGNDFKDKDILTEGIRVYGQSTLIDKFISIKKSEWFSRDEPVINFLLKYSLIDFKREDGMLRKNYVINKRGQRFYEMLVNNSALDLLAKGIG